MSDLYRGEQITLADLPTTLATDTEVTTAISTHVALPDPHTQYILDTEKGAASGVATLASDSKLTTSQARVMSLPVLTGTGLTLGSNYELLSQRGAQYLAIKKFKTFGLSARSIALADSEYGWTWSNRSQLTSGDENTTTANACRWSHNATADLYTSATRTAPMRYRTMNNISTGDSMQVIARVSSDASQNSQFAGIIFTPDSSLTAMQIMQVGWSAGVPKVESYNGSSVQVGITAPQLAAGVWLMIEFNNRVLQSFYSVADQATPPTSWTVLQANNSTFSGVGPWRFGQVMSTTAAAAFTADYKWFDAKGNTDPELWASNPVWGAQGYNATAPAITLLADYDLGPVSPTVNQTQLRNVLSDSVNMNAHDAASWTFSVVRSESLGAVAGTYAAAGSVTVEGSGRYLNVFAKCSSSGIQSGSLRLPLYIPLTPA